MPRIISFAYTTPAFVAARKTVTRRHWKDDYAVTWQPGDLFNAYDKSPRYGGTQIGQGQIVSIRKEPMATMPRCDFWEEGFAYLADHHLPAPRSCPLSSFTIEAFNEWRDSGGEAWVIRFRYLPAASEPQPPTVKGES